MDPFEYREIRGYFTARTPDTTDADYNPDQVPLNGNVTLIPQFQGGSVVFTEVGEFAIPRRLFAQIVDGHLMTEVSHGEERVLQPVFLPVTVDDRANQNWSWRIVFDTLSIGRFGEEVSHPDLAFPVEGGAEPLNLSTIATTARQSGSFITRGAPGPGLQAIVADDGQLNFEYTDGRTTSIDIPESIPGPPGKEGAPGKDGVVPDLVSSNIMDASETGRSVLTAASAAAARSAIGAGTTTVSSGTASELNTGTATTARSWTPKILADYTKSLIPDTTGLAVKTQVANDIAAAVDATKYDLVGQLQSPIIIAHRGGRYVYPEHSLEGYIASAESGFLPEPDIQFLSDGTMVCLHDATVDRTMTGISGNVNTLTRADWLKARIKPTYDGGKSAAPAFFEDVLDQLGNRTVIVPEIKGGATTPEVQKVIDAVKSRGLEKAVIIQSADLTACQQIVAAGCHALLLLNTTLPAGDPVASGVEFIGASQSMSAANLNTVIGWGGKVIIWTVNSRNAVAGFPSGVAGYFSDDPWYTSNRLQSEGVARWRSGQGWPSKHNTEQTSASTGSETSTRQKISGGQLYVDASASNSLTVCTDVSHINGGFTPGNFIMKGTFTLGAKSAASTANVGFILYRNTNGPDSTFYDGAKAGQDALTFVIRRNGQLQGWEYVNGASATNLGTDNAESALIPDGTSKTVELVMTKVGTTVTISCLQTGKTLSTTTRVGGVFTPAIRVSRTECWIGDVSVDPYAGV